MGKRDWRPVRLTDVQPNQWEAGFFDCMSNMGDCVGMCVMPMCKAGDLADRLDGNGCCCPSMVGNACFMTDLRRRVR